MAAINLTAKVVSSARTDKGQEDLFDSHLPGFGLRVYKSGRKTYFFVYRNKHGQRRRYDLGDVRAKSLKEARDEAFECFRKTKKGVDLSAEKRAIRAAETFDELCEQYLENHARPNKKSAREDERIITKYIRPQLGKLKANEIKRKDIIPILQAIGVRQGKQTQANNIRALLSKIFNFGIELEVVESNPVTAIKKFRTRGGRDRVLNRAELKKLLDYLEQDETDPLWKGFFQLLIFTGQRPGEIAAMRWSEIAEDRWTLPGDRVKNGMTHRVPLSIPAQAVISDLRKHGQRLKARSRKTDKVRFDELVFPSRREGNLRWASHKVGEMRQLLKIPHWTAHDIRRTVATHLEDLGVSSDAIDRIQNHKKLGVRGIYQRGDRFEEVSAALNKWGDEVFRIQRDERTTIPGHSRGRSGVSTKVEAHL